MRAAARQGEYRPLGDEKCAPLRLADEPFTIDNEMKTPKQSIRRHVIRARYQARLDALYGGGGSGAYARI